MKNKFDEERLQVKESINKAIITGSIVHESTKKILKNGLLPENLTPEMTPIVIERAMFDIIFHRDFEKAGLRHIERLKLKIIDLEQEIERLKATEYN